MSSEPDTWSPRKGSGKREVFPQATLRRACQTGETKGLCPLKAQVHNDGHESSKATCLQHSQIKKTGQSVFEWL